MKKYSIEFFGTFFLLLISALTENPIAIGLGLASLIYIGAHISGAHYNPAVSIAMVIRGEISKTECLKYTIAQILGAIAGSFIYFLIVRFLFLNNQLQLLMSSLQQLIAKLDPLICPFHHLN